MRKPGIGRRLLVSTGLLLLLFLGGGVLGLLQAFARSSEAAVFERLKSEVYALLAAVEVAEDGRLIPPEELAQPRLAVVNSGLYAEVERGSERWRSASAAGRSVPYPPVGRAGNFAAARLEARGGEPYLGVSFPVEWELDTGRLVPLTVRVAEEAAPLDRQQAEFRRTALLWLLGLGGLVLTGQVLLLRWGLAPLRAAAREVERIGSGKQETLGEDYPAELEPLTATLNRFIAQERARQERYRRALGDLAHSLRTPLSVLRNELEDEPAPAGNELLPEIERMQAIIDRELARAVATGPAPLGGRVLVATVVRRLVASLGKVYAAKPVSVDVAIDAALQVAVDETDLLEMLGNLLENAFRYAATQVSVSARPADQPGMVCVDIRDDGPGIDSGLGERVLERGVTSDPAGTGLGLPMVREAALLYGGRLEVLTAPAGGAQVRLVLPAAAGAVL